MFEFIWWKHLKRGNFWTIALISFKDNKFSLKEQKRRKPKTPMGMLPWLSPKNMGIIGYISTSTTKVSMGSTQSVEPLRNYKRKTDYIFISDFYKIWLQFLNWGSLSITQEAPRGGGPLFASHKLMRTLPNEVPELIRQCGLCQKWQFQHPMPKELWNFKEKS